MSGYAFWDRLWRVHDDTKSLISFNPKLLITYFSKELVRKPLIQQEKDVDLADEIEDAPAEHIERLQTGPGGVGEGEPREYTMRQKIGLFLGPVLFMVMLLIPTPSAMDPSAQKMAAVACLMATWWMTEAIPIPATSLIPIALFPLMGIMHTKEAAAPYASHLIFLFRAGLLLPLPCNDGICIGV